MGRHRLHDCRPVWFVTVSLWRWPPVRAHELCDYPGVSEMWRERAEVAEAKYPCRPEPRRQALLICIGGAVEVQSELVHCDWLSPRTARIIADMVDRCRGPGWPR